jgi:hypothetical protein
MLEGVIERIVDKAIEKRTVRPDKKLTLSGCHPVPEIMGTLYERLFVPFRGTPVLVQVRYPRSTQLPDIDKLFSIINEMKNGKGLDRNSLIETLNIQEACCKAVLNRPAFEEIEKAVYGEDKVYKKRKEELEELRKKAEGSLKGLEKYEVRKEIDRLELFCGYILPDDTMLGLLNIAIGKDISDIKTMTKEKLLAAYRKSRLYNLPPSEFIPGLFTDGDKKNIDDYATYLGSQEEMKTAKPGKKRCLKTRE